MRSEYIKEYQTMIEDCQDRESQLTEWEAEFLESVEEQLYETKSISPKQTAVLDRIWERVTARG